MTKPVRVESGVIVVGMGEMKLASQPGCILVTHALGSCLGIAIHDAQAAVGGILHVMLPAAEISPARAAAEPWIFVDTAVPLFFKAAYALGAEKQRLTVKVAGGAAAKQENDFFAIGKRNWTMLRKLFWQNGIFITNQDVGGEEARTLYLEIGSGRTWIRTQGQEMEL